VHRRTSHDHGTGTLAPNPAGHATARDLWPEHARKLYDHLVGLYGEDDVLPTLAASWIAHQRSVNTQRT
jgi:hypothetical protein